MDLALDAKAVPRAAQQLAEMDSGHSKHLASCFLAVLRMLHVLSHSLHSSGWPNTFPSVPMHVKTYCSPPASRTASMAAQHFVYRVLPQYSLHAHTSVPRTRATRVRHEVSVGTSLASA